MRKQPWIYSAPFDSIFILAPPFVSLLIIILFPWLFSNTDEISTISWIVLVLLIDVGHVYSTLYRTYFDKETYSKQKTVLLSIPVFSFVTGVILYALNPLFFWRILAYLAVFHFIRQQYGFMRIYSRTESQSRYGIFIDKLCIYASTVYPIVYWHLNAPRHFNWFIEGDFYYFKSEELGLFAQACYIIICLLYLVKEVTLMLKSGQLNIPRNLLILGTAFSWYFGIVYFNGDLAFTLLNVVSHGIPYMALVWIYGKKKADGNIILSNKVMRVIYNKAGWLVFISVIILLAYFEEGLWDALVWNEHYKTFGVFHFLPLLTDSLLLAIVVPLLSVPQITHYIIDGYIWKMKGNRFNWKEATLKNIE